MGNARGLQVYIDESGEFWSKGSTKGLSVVSFSWRTDALAVNIPGIEHLEAQLRELGHPGIFHTAPLIHGSGDEYSDLDIATRRHLFWAFFYFIKRSDINFSSIIIDNRYHSTPEAQKACLMAEIQSKFTSNSALFSGYEKIHFHYDDGQPELTKVFNEFRSDNLGVELHISQAHKDSRVFQVADYATFIDRLLYKLKHGISLSKTEFGFFNEKSLKLIQKSRPSLSKDGSR